MNNKNKIAKASIVFYVVAVIFLFVAAFLFYMTYETVVAYKQSYTTTMKDVVGLYLTNVSPYFAYAFILYGIGVILKKFSVMTDTLTTLMDSAVEAKDDDNSVFFDEEEDAEEDSDDDDDNTIEEGTLSTTKNSESTDSESVEKTA